MEKQTNKQNKKMITWSPSHWMKPARIQGVMYICFRYGSINMKWQIESDVHLSDLFVAKNIHVMYPSLLNLQLSTVFPRIIAGGNYFLFRTKRGRLFEEGDCLREALFSNIAHWKSCPKYFVLVYTKTVDSVFRALRLATQSVNILHYSLIHLQFLRASDDKLA